MAIKNLVLNFLFVYVLVTEVQCVATTISQSW